MSQFLPRGFIIDENTKTTKLLSSGDNWQIYLTNRNTYVVAVKTVLYDKWVSEYALPADLFRGGTSGDYRFFASSNHYIISSLENGPFPENIGQIEAFSIAFKTTRDLFPDADIHDAIYIEEYSLILPVSAGKCMTDNKTVYGKWLTGGINVSIGSIERVSKIMSWLPKTAVKNSAHLAGFDADELNEAETDKVQNTLGSVKEQSEHTCVRKTADTDFSLVGRPELEQFFNDNIIDIVLNREKYQKMGIQFPGATILYGPPGCGKTYAVEKLAEYLGWERFDIDSSTIASSYIHDTSKKISEVFHSAINAAPSILVIDEMEAFLTDRSAAGPSGTHHFEEVAEFLRRIPEAISKGVLVFAMTNMIESIDPAVLRRGRFDHIVEVKMATSEEIEALLISKFADLPVDDDVSPAKIAESLDAHPLSDVSFVLREAGRLAVKKDLCKINAECFREAIRLLPPKEKKNAIGFR